MADLESMSRDELLHLCKSRGGQLVQFVHEYERTANIAIASHTELQAEHAATLAELEDLKSQHERTVKRLEVAERLVDQQQTHIRHLKGFGEFMMKGCASDD